MEQNLPKYPLFAEPGRSQANSETRTLLLSQILELRSIVSRSNGSSAAHNVLTLEATD
jgi:hypothetical protein